MLVIFLDITHFYWNNRWKTPCLQCYFPNCYSATCYSISTCLSLLSHSDTRLLSFYLVFYYHSNKNIRIFSVFLLGKCGHSFEFSGHFAWWLEPEWVYSFSVGIILKAARGSVGTWCSRPRKPPTFPERESRKELPSRGLLAGLLATG